jgi:cytochrome b pre-mRNA-processing protein 3
MCVADTFAGRFDLVTLHVGLIMRRLTGEDEAGTALSRSLVEQMFSALDDDMRAIGVGDLSVPKKVQAAASSFYGRLRAYNSAMTELDDAALASALERNVEAAVGKALLSRSLAAYARATAGRLDGQTMDDIGRAELNFPDPQEFVS